MKKGEAYPSIHLLAHLVTPDVVRGRSYRSEAPADYGRLDFLERFLDGFLEWCHIWRLV